MALNNSTFYWNKKNIKNYFEIYLEVPNNELMKRDPKGIYKNFKKGIIKNISGFDIPFDEPKKPDLKIDWKKTKKLGDMVKKILQKIDK